MVIATRQNAGRSANASFEPSGGANCPAETACAELTLAFDSASDHSRAHAAASTPLLPKEVPLNRSDTCCA
jgi:hypothetical protein